MSLPPRASHHGLDDDPAHDDAVGSFAHAAPLQPFALPAAACAIFALFLIRVLASLLPPAPMNPLWQLSLASTLVTHGFLPLLGLCLFHIWRVNTAGGRSQHQRLIHFCRRLNRLTVLAALGFVLLLPLQCRAAYELISTNFSAIRAGAAPSPSQRRFDAIADVIRKAPDLRTLENHLVILRGPAIAPQDRDKPLPEIKAVLSQALNRARQLERENVDEQVSMKAWPLIRDVGVTSLAALVHALGFSAFAQSRSAGRGPVESAVPLDQTLLDDFLEGFDPTLTKRVALEEHADDLIS